ncbi:MAG: MFS transporter [Vicinamibacteria bacterium]
MTSSDPQRASRNASVAAFMTFSAFLGLGFVLPFLPLFVQELGVTDPRDAAQWAGILIGVGPLLAGLLASTWGGLADLHGYKRVALVALIALGLSQIIAALAQTPEHVLISRILSGLFGGIGPLGLAMASGSEPRGSTHASRAIGKIQAAQILAAGFGPLLGGFLASSLGIRPAFWGASLACLLAAAIVGMFYEEGERALTVDVPASGAREEVHKTRFFAALIFTVFFVNFASRSFTPILPGQLADFGVPKVALAVSTGILISVYSVAAAASSFMFGKWATVIAPVWLLALSLGGSLFSAISMTRVPTFGGFLVVAAMYGLVSGGSLTLGYTIGSKRFSEASRGASFGKLSGAALVGGAVSPALAAWVARGAMADVYWMNALVYVVLIAVALLFLRD